MTLTDISSGATERSAQDLFEEAHRRRHRRRLAAVSASAVVLVVGLIVAVLLGGGRSVAPLVTTSPNFASAVTNATRSSGSAQVVVTTRHSEPGCPWAQTVATGTVDFARHSMATRTVSAHSAYNLCTDPTGTQQRQFGNVLYQTVPPERCAPQGCHVVVSGGSRALTPGRWLRIVGSTSAPSFAGGSTTRAVDSPYALVLLRAISGPVHRAGEQTIDGVQATKYTAVVSLADVQRAVLAAGDKTADALSSVLSSPGSRPSASAIALAVQLWVDRADRLVQMTVGQPFFMVNFVGGASSGAMQFTPGYGQPGLVPSDRPYQQGSYQATVAFSNFGTSQAVIPPPSRLVTNVR